MAFTSIMYGLGVQAAYNKEIDLDTDTIQVWLTTVTHTPNQDTHDYANDLTNEVAGGSYARKTLGGKTVSYTGGTNVFKFDATDVQYTTATFTFRNIHVLDTQTAVDATSPLITAHSNDADITGGGGNLDIVWNANGIFTITV